MANTEEPRDAGAWLTRILKMTDHLDGFDEERHDDAERTLRRLLKQSKLNRMTRHNKLSSRRAYVLMHTAGRHVGHATLLVRGDDGTWNEYGPARAGGDALLEFVRCIDLLNNYLAEPSTPS